MTSISRRTVAKGAAWSVPLIATASAVPAVAASPCASVKAGSPLPAQAFRPTYLAITNQTFGGAVPKALSLVAGISVDPAYVVCTGSAALSLDNSTAPSALTQTNDKTYRVTGGTEAAGTGTAGSRNTGCSGGDNTAQACITIIAYTAEGSAYTRAYDPKAMSFSQQITVAGFGTTQIYINAQSFISNGAKWDGSGLTITSTPAVTPPA